MPNRYLRENFIESEKVNSVSFQAETAWTHLLVVVDDWGRCEANITFLRPKLFPGRLNQVRETDLQRWLAECEKAGLVRIYQHAGKPFLQMMQWEKGRAIKSYWPDPPPQILSTCYRRNTDENICTQMKTFPPGTDYDSDPDSDKGVPPPVFEPIPAKLFRRELEAMLKDAKADLKKLTDNPANYGRVLSKDAAELVAFLETSKPGNWEGRIAEVKKKPENYARGVMRPGAKAAAEAWRSRIVEIQKRMNGIK